MRAVVTLRRAQLYGGACTASSGRYHIELTVNGTRIGDPDRELGQGDHQLGGDGWRHTFDDDGGSLEIRATVRDGDCRTDTVEQTWRAPYIRERAITGNGWLLLLHVQAPGRARQAPPQVSVPRSSSNAPHRATVVAPSPQIRFEIDPVIPFPVRSTSPQTPPTLERRELRAGGAGTSRLINPSVLVRSSDSAWTATISYTRIWAPGWSEADLGARIQWRARSLAGGASVEFAGGQRGLSVRVRGSAADGEVAIDAQMGGRVLATHRALVRRPVDLPIRFTHTEIPSSYHEARDYNGALMHVSNTYLAGSTTSAIAEANRRVAALGLRLAPTHDGRVGQNMRRLDEPGCFAQATLDEADLVPPYNRLGQIVHRSATEHVISFVFIPTLPEGSLGESVLLCLAASNQHDDGDPSSSLDAPEGGRQEIQAFTSHPRPEVLTGVSNTENLYGGALRHGMRGDTIAHETGHILGLKHRHPGDDGRPLRPENLMAPSGGLADFDILQARVVWASAVVRHWHRQQHGSDPP